MFFRKSDVGSFRFLAFFRIRYIDLINKGGASLAKRRAKRSKNKVDINVAVVVLVLLAILLMILIYTKSGKILLSITQIPLQQ